MTKHLELNRYQKETLLLAVLLQLENDGKQIVVNDRFIRKAQEMKDQAGKSKAWDWVYNPSSKTLEYFTIKPKKKTTTIEQAFSDLLEKLEDKHEALTFHQEEDDNQ